MGIGNYVFVPMLTNHRIDNEGNKIPKMMNGKSESLFSFIGNCQPKSLCHWEKWLSRYVESYNTLEPVDETYFVDDRRDDYWTSFKRLLKQKNAFIFIDPDTGLESGTKSYLERMGREKYILNHEIDLLYNFLDVTSILMIYQHLPNNKHVHEAAVSKKLKQLCASNSDALVCGYREDDLVFLFMAKEPLLFNRLCSSITKYYSNSEHRYKSLHLSDSQKSEIYL